MTSGNTDLFEQQQESFRPLADRMRPRNLQEFYGQLNIVGESSPLRKQGHMTVLFIDEVHRFNKEYGFNRKPPYDALSFLFDSNQPE